MSITIRKWVTNVEEILVEGQLTLEAPRRRAVIAVVLSNPYAGRYSEDISELIDMGGVLAPVLMQRAIDALGTPVEAYGKGGIVGENGEIEHIAALLHPKFGGPVREPVEGKSILPSVKKMGAIGATLDIPIHHIKAMLVRSHFDSVEFRIPDAPGVNEIMVALAVADGGRPHPRVGGLSIDEVVGEDGLR
jgi:hypothetical protein